MNRSVVYALLAAALFGASTPVAKSLLDQVDPALLGGLLYLGSGLGLAAWRAVRDRGWRSSGLAPSDWPWLLGAILFGGVIGPLALMHGLARTQASTAALLLNMESVLTALIAWLAFRENADRRVVAGMALIVAGGVVLSWTGRGAAGTGWTGQALVVMATLCWAIDNNLTRQVSGNDAAFIALAKGLVAGLINCLLPLLAGAALPAPSAMAAAMSVGLFGYGLSLALFVVALRELGAARTGAYFSTAPFLGAVLSIALLNESLAPSFWLAAPLMVAGVWLHLTERHAHEHAHEPVEHTHAHVHDAHHGHEHAAGIDPREPHTHAHSHPAMRHSHPHFPDTHHRHRH